MECGEFKFVLFLPASQRRESGARALDQRPKGIDLDQATLKE
jgi:hypothetical protein